MTSDASSLFLVLAGVMLALLLYGCIAIFVRPRSWLKRERKRLQVMPASALASEALAAAAAFGIRKQFPNALLFTARDSWNAPLLLAALDELYKQSNADDTKTGAAGPGGWVFAYYDSGLALIHEVLEEGGRADPH
jgi:hypothetical protein